MAGIGILEGLGGLFGGLAAGPDIRLKNLAYKQALQDMAAQSLIGRSMGGMNLGQLGSDMTGASAAAADAIARQRAVQGMFGSPEPMEVPQQTMAPQAPTPQHFGNLTTGGALDLIARDESGNRNVPNYRFDPGHTASGLYQITDSTWNRYAPQRGLPSLSYPQSPMDMPAQAQRQVAGDILSKEGTAPWANYNPKLASDLKASYASLPPEHQEAASDVAIGAAGQLPPQLMGKASPSMIAQLVDRVAGSSAPDDVKGAALMKLLPLMSQEGQHQFAQQLEIAKLQEHREEFGVRIGEIEANREQTRELARARLGAEHGADWQILQTPDGKALRVNRQTGETQPIDLPAGATKLGSRPPEATSQFTDADVDYWAKVLKSGGHLPPGLARTRGGSEFVQRVMAKMGHEGGDPGEFIANVATVKADSSSLTGMTRMADAATSFEQTAIRNFDVALKLSKDAVPTNWGPWLNKWVETGETQFGDENVPPYVTAMMTAANEYAKIMGGSTGAQGATVDARREAAELFSPYLNKGQIARVVAIAKQDMENRKQSLYGQIGDIKDRLRSGGSGQPTEMRGQGGAPGGAARAPQAGPGPDQIGQMMLPDILSLLQRHDLSNEQRRAIDARLNQLQSQ